MALCKLLPIWFCGHCTNVGRKECGTMGCYANGKFIAFDDQDDLANIPDWCPLETAPKKAEAVKTSHNIASRPLKIGAWEMWPGRMDSDHVWIQEAGGGEGGDFKIADLAPVIEKFYSEHF